MRDSSPHPRLNPVTFLAPPLSSSLLKLILICAAAGLLTACALPPPDTLVSPAPIPGVSGKFLNPYLANGKLAPWADKGVHADRSGAAVGAFAASEAIGIIDITGMAANAAAEAIKQKAAIDASGGQEYMNSTSDSSFKRREDFVIFLYVNHSTNELYKKTLELIQEIYPDIGWNYDSDIRNAPKKPTTAPAKGPA